MFSVNFINFIIVLNGSCTVRNNYMLFCNEPFVKFSLLKQIRNHYELTAVIGYFTAVAYGFLVQ